MHGYIVTGVGLMLLVLNLIHSPTDDPETNRRAAWIGFGLIGLGALLTANGI